jgi:hypothetical protein
MKHKNFYENVQEANLRLRQTVVWYDGPGEQGPYHVLIITGDTGDEYKIYMKKIGEKLHSIPNEYSPDQHYSSNVSGAGEKMDDYMKRHPTCGIVRKDLSSPYFKGFRPFPLGMMNLVRKDKSGKNIDCETSYLERTPNRLTQQGLIRSMITFLPVTAAMSRPPQQIDRYFDMFSEDFYDCIMGNYPSVDTCLSKLTDVKIANEAAAFHRYFALVKGPIGMIFLSYKGEIVGLLDNKNLSSVTVDRDYRYTKEAIADLHVFNNII